MVTDKNRLTRFYENICEGTKKGGMQHFGCIPPCGQKALF